MSTFFNAPATRAAMAEIQELQEDIMTGIAVRGMNQPTSEEGHLYINKMRQLLEKQRNFMFRLHLETEDPDALEMKEQILESAKFLGLKDGQNISQFFETLSDTLEKLENDLPSN
ncbi:MAG: hypothetical protein CMA53_02395 [Euryarchaeota archaeon]|nr:hypothetical protein [Euryarchaeota archaeon]|tara:strand:+ start:110 stop:454 length:345 start_codon:yes stop_codon:yes gene_type:complete